MASLLLHTCCAPCATYCTEDWQQKGMEVTSFWYNPNIHPFTEHQRRLETLQEFAQQTKLPLIVSEGYDVINYFQAVVGHERERCSYCFRLRLSMTALIAKLRGFDAFTTTLLISPYQKHELLKGVGEEIARKEGVDFLYEDLRNGYSESHRMSQELDLYRQKYCGCLYSEWERFGKVKI
jgi:predicted adenine nucleotide alpha hydrolase (AANH) superfamily ATPase